MNAEPSSRAVSYTSAVARFRQLPEKTAEAIASHVDAALLRRIETAHASDWLALSEILPLKRALYQELDRAAYAAFWRANAVRSLESPFVKGTLMLLTKTGLVTPFSVAKTLPSAHQTHTRGMGAIAKALVEEKERQVVVRWVEIPDAILREPCFLEAFRASYEVVFHVCRIESGVVELVTSPDHSASLRFRWR